MSRGFEHRLQLGETKNLKENIFEKRLKICYTGRCATDQYSIAVIMTFGNNSFAYNLYFASTQKTIMLPKAILTIIEVDEQSFYFVYKPL